LPLTQLLPLTLTSTQPRSYGLHLCTRAGAQHLYTMRAVHIITNFRSYEMLQVKQTLF